MSREDLWNYNRCRERLATLRGRLGFADTRYLELLRLRLDLASGILTTEPGNAPVPGLQAVVNCILATYSRAMETPESFRLIPFREMPGGHAYDATFHMRAVIPLADLYTKNPRKFHGAMEMLGGILVAFAHHAWKMYALPRVPVYILIWDGSDEFPPSAALFFDASVPAFLETEAAVMLGELVTQRIAFFCNGQ